MQTLVVATSSAPCRKQPTQKDQLALKLSKTSKARAAARSCSASTRQRASSFEIVAQVTYILVLSQADGVTEPSCTLLKAATGAPHEAADVKGRR